jgi:hypothetical protein
MSQSAAPSAFKSGERVRILDAQPGNADPKGLVYYDYFRNLIGTVVKAYDDGTVAISVERNSLPAEIRQRHEECERLQRDRWLNGLSEEERNKLTQKEQRFSLKYTLLVSAKHVAAEPTSSGSSRTKPAAAASAPASPSATSDTRPTSADLDAAEEQYLRSKQE